MKIDAWAAKDTHRLLDHLLRRRAYKGELIGVDLGRDYLPHHDQP
jgi:hypothetical protein